MTDRTIRRRLAAVFIALWLALAVAPLDRADWALENLLVVALGLALWAWRRRLAFSPLSSACLFVFLCLHAVGAHYTYSLVPYDRWLEALSGATSRSLLGFERNHFDRLVHFAFGLLLLWPIREALLRTSGVRGAWSRVLPLTAVTSLSAFYEVLEWLAAASLGSDLGIAYVGAQGDVWDAQKDMALAAGGAFLALAIGGLRSAMPPGRTPSRRGAAAWTSR